MQYTVRNWRKFQHYKDRNPPWIKLHFELLSSSDWVMLADASRLLAIVIMLVASRNDGQIDGTEAGLVYLQRVAYLSKRPDLKPLIECGFLESASGCKQMLADARPETETEDIKKGEENASNVLAQPPKVSSKGSRLNPKNLNPVELFEVCKELRPDLDPQETFDSFRDYWISTPGAKGVKLDWMATWRNWVRRQHQRSGIKKKDDPSRLAT